MGGTAQDMMEDESPHIEQIFTSEEVSQEQIYYFHRHAPQG